MRVLRPEAAMGGEGAPAVAGRERRRGEMIAGDNVSGPRDAPTSGGLAHGDDDSMSTRNRSRAPEGIEVRTAKDGRKSYRASVWSARDQKRIRKTFPTLAAAKAWRQD